MADNRASSSRPGFGGTHARILTAVLLIPVVVTAVLWAPTALVTLLTMVVLFLCLVEFFYLATLAGLRGYPRWTTFCALMLVLVQWAGASVAVRSFGGQLLIVREPGSLLARLAVPVELLLLVFVFGAAVLAVLSRRPVREAPGALGVSAAAMLLVALPLSYAVRLHGADPLGRKLLLFVLVLVWAGDTLAYFTGRLIGRRPLAPVLSPKKTWEGAAANLVAALFVAALLARWVGVEVVQLALVAALANLAGQLGDLAESAYKRAAGVKDSGALLPGHGGMLDRVDSLLFALPVVWGYLWILEWR
ncbi:MAG: phosphatidate cytidylyltransferase [Acidobacteriia bacterium]|nr:phosphatidate cytidylyltransferase [Terriglobia bacterium]